jgi:hypothetical protein
MVDIETNLTPADVIVAHALQLFNEKLPMLATPCECQLHRSLAMGGGDSALLYRAIDRAAGKMREEAGAGHEMNLDEAMGFINRIVRRGGPSRAHTAR